MASLAACAVTVSTSGSTKQPREAAARSFVKGIVTWDLRTRPDRSAVGLRAGEDVSAFVTTDPRPIKLLLPHGRVLTTQAKILTFESIQNGLAGLPSSLDVSGELVRADLGYARYRQNLAELGLPSTLADTWRATVRTPPSGDPRVPKVSSGTATQVGYLSAGIGVRYLPQDRWAKVAWILDLGATKASAAPLTASRLARRARLARRRPHSG